MVRGCYVQVNTSPRPPPPLLLRRDGNYAAKTTMSYESESGRAGTQTVAQSFASPTPANNHVPPRRYIAVVEMIMSAIGTGRLGPGDRLPSEQVLASRCAASRPTVREGLLVLELFGVLDIRPRSGAYVTSHGAQTAARFPNLFDSSPRELLEARQQVEPGVARLCATRMNTKSLSLVEGLVDACESVLPAESGDHVDEFLLLSHEFHAVLATHCGNETLATITRQLVDLSMHPLWRMVNGLHIRSIQTRGEQIAEHRVILAAIAGGDGAAAADAMTGHLCALSSGIFGRPGMPPLSRHRRRKLV
jgi:GntR family transcriptional repressor for pyruvate dehydrogenase complex